MRIYEFFSKLKEYCKYLKKIIKKDNKIKENENKLISLAPTTNANFIDDYFDYIHNGIYEEDDNGKRKNKLIGLLGNFDTGKSSIINTYLRKDNLLKKTSLVSVGSYCEKKNINEIEKAILQQLVYSINPNCLPKSKVERINLSNSFFSRFLNSLIITLFCVIIFVLFNFNFFKDKLNDINFLILFVISIFLLLVILFNLLPRIFIMLKKTKISIGIFDLEVSNDENNNVSLLDKNIDEIVYLFSATSKEIVVLEDLDRLDENTLKELLTNLKYINTTINIALFKKNVQFIYCIGENIFSDSKELYKYFDLPIPILPYSSYSNSIELFMENINDEVANEYVYDVASYVSGSREVYAIINQYNIFKNNCTRDEKKKCLYLALYKVLYPNKFTQLYDRKGILAYSLSNEYISNVKEKYIEVENSKIDTQIKLETEKYKERVMFNTNNLINIILKKGDRYKYISCENGYIVSLDAIKEDFKLIFKLKDIYFFVEDDLGNVLCEEQVFEDFTKQEFFDSMDTKKYESIISDLDNKKIKYVNYSDIDANTKLDILKGDLYKQSIYYLKEDKYDTLEILEKRIIEGNLFDKFIYDIISKRHDKNISNNDLFILRNMYQNYITDYNIKICDSKFILNKVNKSDFIYDSFCIIDLYRELFNRQDYEDYLNIAFDNLSYYKLNFFFELSKTIHNLFDKIKKYHKKIWLFIAGNDIDDEVTKYYLMNTLIYLNQSKFSKTFSSFLSRYNKILFLLEDIYYDIDKVLQNIDIKFNTNIDYNPVNKKIIRYIYENNMYDVTIAIYSSMCKILGIPFNENKVIELLYIDDFRNNLINDFSYILSELECDNIRQNNSNEFIIKLLNDLDLSDDLKNRVLQLETTKIQSIKKIDNKYYSKLLELDLLEINWDNIYQLYNVNNSLSEEEIKFIIDNIDLLSNDNSLCNEYIELAFELCNHD